MKKKKLIILFSAVVVCLAVVIGVVVHNQKSAEPTPEEMIERLEAALGDDYKKQLQTELVATLTYGNKNEDNDDGNIYYRILKTTYYEADPAEMTGLNTDAFNVLFPVDNMDSCETMKIQDWDAALYKKDDVAFLCWTYSPEVSYVLEYNPNFVADSEIIKMAESAKVMDEE